MKRLLGLLLALILLGAGGYLMWSGFNQPPEEAPQIEVPIVAPKDQEPVGPTAAEVKQYPPEDENGNTADEKPKDVQMSPEAMKPNHLFIPSLGVYGHINQYKGKLENDTLTLPGAYEVTRWQGGSNVKDKKGNILIAGHVSWNGVHGLIHDLAHIKAGNLAYITDEEGNRQAFQLQKAETIKKEVLPQEIWDTTGPKQLVVVTCGGEIYRRSDGSMHFDSNVIATFVPVEEAPASAPSASPSPTS